MPPVSPDGGFRFAKTISDLYGDAVAQLLSVVARRLAAGITERGWAENKLSELLATRRDAQQLVARLADEVDSSLYDLLVEAYSTGILSAGGPGVRAAESAIVATNRGAVQAYAAELAGTLKSTHTRILRSTEDIYRRVIADTVGNAVAGAQTRREVAARALSRAASAGVTGFTDSRGRQWQLESYVEMATRTATGQAHIQGGLDRYVQQGRTLVIVSDVPEECELCRPFEGRVLSLTGVDPPPAALRGARYGGSLARARSRGFLPPNCRHALDAFVPGLSETPPRPTADPEGAKERARQRALERRIRMWKQRAAATEAFPDTQAHRAAVAQVRTAQADMRTFIAETDRKRLPAREQLGAR